MTRDEAGADDRNVLLLDLAHAFEVPERSGALRYQHLFSYFVPGEIVLDLGCGSGVLLGELADRGISCVGVDIDARRVEETSARGVEAHCRAAEEFVREETRRFHGIFLMHLIEHMEGRDMFNLVFDATRLLAPGGRMVIVTPHYAHGIVSAEHFWLDVTHKRPYPIPLVEVMMQVLGLQVLEARVSPWSSISSLVIGTRATPVPDSI